MVVGPSGINIALVYSRWHCGRSVSVRNKAGWISEDGCYSTCDAGLIDVDGHSYVMSIMTSMPWSDQSSEAVAAIAKALYDVRSSLA